MNRLIATLALSALLAAPMATAAQTPVGKDSAGVTLKDSSAAAREAKDSIDDTVLASDEAAADADIAPADEDNGGFHKELKTKFIEGNAGFMSLVALALVIGLAFCIERIIYLTLSEIDAKKFMGDISARVESGDIEGAKDLCRETRASVASICYQD